MRYVLNNQPDTELALMLNWHLHKGLTALDELAIQALELSLMGSVCNTAGYVGAIGVGESGRELNLKEITHWN